MARCPRRASCPTVAQGRARWPAALATILVIASALSAQVRAAPVAKWARLEGLSAELRRDVTHFMRSRCVPDSREVAMPVYPDADLIAIDWGRVKPACVAREGWSDLGGITLVSMDDEEQVAAWYAAQLADYRLYRAAQGRLFIRAQVPEFLWDRDYHKHPNIAIMAAPAEWAAAGYRTLIELNRPAPQ